LTAFGLMAFAGWSYIAFRLLQRTTMMLIYYAVEFSVFRTSYEILFKVFWDYDLSFTPSWDEILIRLKHLVLADIFVNFGTLIIIGGRNIQFSQNLSLKIWFCVKFYGFSKSNYHGAKHSFWLLAWWLWLGRAILLFGYFNVPPWCWLIMQWNSLCSGRVMRFCSKCFEIMISASRHLEMRF